jgi:hypothetical protein
LHEIERLRVKPCLRLLHRRALDNGFCVPYARKWSLLLRGALDVETLVMELCVVFATSEKMQHQSSRFNGCRSAAVSTDFWMATGKLPQSTFEI